MGRLNWGRILAGGMLTGLLIFASGGIITAMSRGGWEAAMTALGSEFSDPTQVWPVDSVAVGTAIQFGMGIVAPHGRNKDSL